MKLRTPVFPLLVLAQLISLIGCGSVVPDPTNRPSTNSTDDKTFDLPLSYSSEVPDVISPEQPIILAIIVRNVSHPPCGISFMNPSTEFSVDLFKDGSPVTETREGRLTLAKARSFHDSWIVGGSYMVTHLNFSEQLKFQIDLRRLYQIREPGRYLAIVRKTLWIGTRRVALATAATFVLGAPLKPEPYMLVYPPLKG